jgi:hypothetical protein
VDSSAIKQESQLMNDLINSAHLVALDVEDEFDIGWMKHGRHANRCRCSENRHGKTLPLKEIRIIQLKSFL